MTKSHWLQCGSLGTQLGDRRYKTSTFIYFFVFLLHLNMEYVGCPLHCIAFETVSYTDGGLDEVIAQLWSVINIDFGGQCFFYLLVKLPNR